MVEVVEPEKIIVRMPNWIGDAVCGTPVLSALREACPDAEITVMCQANVAPLFEHDRSINELFLFHRAATLLRRIRDRSIIAKLRTGHYDLGILLTHSFSSAWRFWQGKVKRTIGFSRDFRRFLLDDALPLPKEKEHIVNTYGRLLSPLGLAIQGMKPKLVVTDDEKKRAWELVKRFDIRPDQTLIGINPGAAYGLAKCWLPKRFRSVAEQLVAADPSYVVLFFGGDLQKELSKEICAHLPPRVVNLAGQTNLRELMALISCCSVVLTNDSGPMHIADSLKVPLVALFGSTDPVVTGPYNQPDAVLSSPPPCSPCFKRTCPIDFPCMKAIQVEAVLEKIFAKLAKGAVL